MQGERSDQQFATPLRRVEPKYPSTAKERGVQGAVRLEALVRADGTVEAACVYRPLDPDLDSEAAATVKLWRFSPATREGRAVPTWVAIELKFSSNR